MAEYSDAFVFFGATGDLAYKQIFPALQALTKRGRGFRRSRYNGGLDAKGAQDVG